MNWVLMGHRGSGKTTLGRVASGKLGRSFVDLDEEVQRRTGKSHAELIQESEEKFREEELRSWEDLPDSSIIAPGAGIREIPTPFLVAWIRREGWEIEAMRNRPRLKPNMTKEEEIQWMIQEREERYSSWADLCLEIPSYENEEASASRLLEGIERMEASIGKDLLRKSWWIGRPDGLERIEKRVFLSKSQGIELRSDLFSKSDVLGAGDKTKTLLSLRSEDTTFLKQESDSVDIDQRFLGGDPENVIVSSHDPEWKKPHFPKGAAGVKWAPTPRSFEDLHEYRDWSKDLRQAWSQSTILPQGERWKWLRVIENLGENPWSYLTDSWKDSDAGTLSWSHASCFAHASPKPKFFGLIGDPVGQSRGEVFHNAFFRQRDINAIYLSIPVQENELGLALKELHKLGFEGLSVTSPHKQKVLDEEQVVPDALVAELGATNTLLRDPKGLWQATNTDLLGMEAMIQEAGVSPNEDTLLIGKGGVSTAVKGAFLKMGWRNIQEVSSRDKDLSKVLQSRKWGITANLSGRNLPAVDFETEVGMDLRYGSMEIRKFGQRFFAGEPFFEAQARAQRRFWGLED